MPWVFKCCAIVLVPHLVYSVLQILHTILNKHPWHIWNGSFCKKRPRCLFSFSFGSAGLISILMKSGSCRLRSSCTINGLWIGLLGYLLLGWVASPSTSTLYGLWKSANCSKCRISSCNPNKFTYLAKLDSFFNIYMNYKYLKL